MRAGSSRYWYGVAAYVVTLLSIQPFLGFGVDMIKERWGEATLDGVGYAGGALGAILVVWILSITWTRQSAAQRLSMSAGLLAYAVGVVLVRYPQERLHFLEYGLLAGLLYAGLLGDRPRRPPGAGRDGTAGGNGPRLRVLRGRLGAEGWAPALGAAGLGTGVGLVDELLQILWPRRYFDWVDVGLNVVAVALGLVIAVPAANAWLRERNGSTADGDPGSSAPC